MIIKYMTIDEARVYLGISQKKLNKLIQQGFLKTVPDTLKLGLVLVKKEDVDNLKMQLK
jgi:excisionase family DNA binding protein